MGKPSARWNHRTTLPQSRPLGVPAPSEREPGGAGAIHPTAQKPGQSDSTPVDKSVESVNNSGENRGKGVGSQLLGPETQKNPVRKALDFWHGDPYGNRTHVTAVKGRCLNRLTNGPYCPRRAENRGSRRSGSAASPGGSGDWIRTGDNSGMNRVL